jgi:hypothetical protein
VKLSALARQRAGGASLGPASGFPGGATLREAGGTGWVLIDDGIPSRLGAAMAWAWQQEVNRLAVVVDGPGREKAAGRVARRAALFDATPQVLVVQGRDLVEVAPAPPEPPSRAPDGTAALAATLRRFDVTPIVEGSTLRGEILGLEIARAVPAHDGWELSVGVGRHDRQARAELHAGQDPVLALAEVAATVRRMRSPGARRHPANTLARERWLRSIVVARPGLAGASRLEPVEMPLAADRIGPAPAAALGEHQDGSSVLVVCSTGVDLDLVPAAADARLSWDARARLVLVLPSGDDLAVTRHLAASLLRPADVVTVRRDWPALTPG